MGTPANWMTAEASSRNRRPSSRKTLAIAVSVLVIAALAIAAVVLWPAGSKDQGADQSLRTIPASAFLVRDGKFDCSTLYDESSLNQLTSSGLAAIPGFDSFDTKPTPSENGRIVCGSASGTKLGVDVSYLLVSSPSACGPDDHGTWRHNEELRSDDDTVVGLASMLSDDSRGCLFVAGMRDAEATTDEADAAIAEQVKHIAEGISPVLDASLRAGARESESITPTFIRDGHYDCRAYGDTTTMREAQEIGLTQSHLPAADGALDSTGTASSASSKDTADAPVTCGFSKGANRVDVLTSADADAAICAEHSGLPLKAMPGWSYFVDARSTQNPSRGSDQGEFSLNLLHRDEDKGCIIVRSYSYDGTLLDTSDAVAELSAFAGSIDALNSRDSANEQQDQQDQQNQQEEK